MFSKLFLNNSKMAITSVVPKRTAKKFVDTPFIPRIWSFDNVSSDSLESKLKILHQFNTHIFYIKVNSDENEKRISKWCKDNNRSAVVCRKENTLYDDIPKGTLYDFDVVRKRPNDMFLL